MERRTRFFCQVEELGRTVTGHERNMADIAPLSG
jgi:hypothetical protein